MRPDEVIETARNKLAVAAFDQLAIIWIIHKSNCVGRQKVFGGQGIEDVADAAGIPFATGKFAHGFLTYLCASVAQVHDLACAALGGHTALVEIFGDGMVAQGRTSALAIA